MQNTITLLTSIAIISLLASCSQNTNSTAQEIPSVSQMPVIDTQSSVDNNATQALSGVTKTGQQTYGVPEGHIVTTEYSATIMNDIITNVSVSMISGDHESRRYHNRFSQRLRNATVGKKISELNLHAIGGASLTTIGFEEFLSSEF